MDLIQLIREKTARFVGSQQHDRLLSVVHHIEVAEKHRERASQEGNEYLFTDVIYRTNHAFEGILKEAYGLLTSRDPSSATPYQIENYMELNNILRERVRALLTNYRVEWRNPSTHDHRVFFTEQEAFLAVVSICAFVNILLDQLLEKVAFDRERQEVERTGQRLASTVPGYQSLGLCRTIVELLKEYSARFPHAGNPDYVWSQAERLGGLTAFIQFFDDKMEISREVSVESNKARGVADMVLRKGNEAVIIDVRRARKLTPLVDADVEQMISYLTAAGIQAGIVFFAPDQPVKRMADALIEKQIKGTTYTVVEVYPERS